MLTPQQLAQAKQAQGGVPTASSAMTPEQANSWITNTSAPAASPVDNAIDTVAGPLAPLAKKIIPTVTSDVQKIGTDLNNRVDATGKILNSTDSPASKVLQTAGEGFGAVNDVAGEAIGGAVKAVVPPEILSSIGAHLTPLAQSAMQTPAGKAVLNWWGTLNPETQRNLSAGGQIASLLSNAIGAGAAKEGVTATADAVAPVVDSAIQATKDATSPVVSAAKDSVLGTPEEQAAAATAKTAAQSAKDTQSTISAIDPELTGAKNAKAYQQVVTGNRTVTKSGLFTEQSLSPAERTIQQGTRLAQDVSLSDGTSVGKVVLGKDPIKNQTILRQALTDTENKLTTALKGDPEINYNADKPTLFESLNDARNNAPNEFRIGENKKVTADVFNFANKVVTKADDSIEGIRDARTSFDAQARMQYPNAFNPDGTVNVKTAAGNAVKKARDVINEHLYNTAPAGSDIQKLIAREADIFQVNPSVSAKAAAGAGKTIPEKVLGKVKDHPVAASLGAAATGVAAAKAVGF